MEYDNEMYVVFKSKSENEGFARVSVSAFVSQLDPVVSELTDIKTAVSEAVTNAIIHGYDDRGDGDIYVGCRLKDNIVYIEVRDEGAGIHDIEEARKPLYTSKPQMERSGMGFTVMETFMDSVEVISGLGSGTTIHMSKEIKIS